MNRLKQAILFFGFCASFCVHAQLDSTKNVKTVKSIAPPQAAFAAPLSAGEVTFESFLKRYEGKSYHAEVGDQVYTKWGVVTGEWPVPFITKKVGIGGSSWHHLTSMDIYFPPGKLCIKAVYNWNETQRSACIDSNGSISNVERWYKADRPCFDPNDGLIADRCIWGWFPEWTKQTERIAFSAKGLSIFTPRRLDQASEPVWTQGVCVRIDRDSLDKGLGASIVPCTSPG